MYRGDLIWASGSRRARQPAPGTSETKSGITSQVRVTSRQHRGKPRGFLLAPTPLAGLLEMAMAADDLQRAFAVNFLLEPPQGLIYRLAFFQLNLCQT